MIEQCEIKTYGMAMFYVPEGMYTIEELEELISDFKQAKEIQDNHLKLAILNQAAEDNGEEL